MCSQNIKVRILYNYTNSKNMYISVKRWYNTNIRTKLYKIRTKKRCFMANKTTVALTENQFRELIKQCMKEEQASDQILKLQRY